MYMKRFFLFAVFAFAGLNATQAQKYEYEDGTPADAPSHHREHRHGGTSVSDLRFGAYFAPTIAWMHPTTGKSDNGLYSVSSEGSKLGYMWGLMMDYYFAENYALSTGFNLNTGGGIISTQYIGPGAISSAYVTSNVYKTKFNYNMQYLEVPFNLKLRSDELGTAGIQLFGQLGLSVGFNLAHKATYTVQYSDSTGSILSEKSGNNEKLRGTLAVPPVIFALNVGGGVEYPVTDKMSIYAGIFFNNGFAPDATNPGNYDLGYNGSFKDGNTRLNNFAIRLGIFF